MDADTFRIVLAVAGGVFLLLLYLWERRRAAGRDAPDTEETVGDSRRDPVIGGAPSGAEDFSVSKARVIHRDAPAAEPAPEVSAQAAPPEPPASAPSASAAEPPPADTDEAMIVKLFLVSDGEPFNGGVLFDAAANLNLLPGPRGVFERFADGTYEDSLLSMANLVNPGTFPFEDMSDFETMGVTLFAVLDGRPEDQSTLEELLVTAQRLRADLGARVLDADRSVLTPAKCEYLRDRLLNFLHRKGVSKLADPGGSALDAD